MGDEMFRAAKTCERKANCSFTTRAQAKLWLRKLRERDPLAKCKRVFFCDVCGRYHIGKRVQL